MTYEEGTRTMTARILAFAGSLRRESFNKKLVPIAAKGARDAGAQVTLIGLEDFPLPLFDQDLEARQGMPENGMKLKQLFIDWVSRPAPGEPSLVAFRSKVATLLSASPGALGGLRGLVHVRSILSNIGVIVLPDQIAVAKAHEAFNADGFLKDSKQQSGIEGLGHTLASFLMKLKG